MRRKRSHKAVKHTRTTTKEYLRSDHWEQVKRDYATDDEVCEICGVKHWHDMRNGKRKANRMFVFHHKHYRTVGHESREDLMRICKRDHDLCHEIMRIKDDCEMVHELKEIVKKYFIYEPTHKNGSENNG